MPNHVKNVITVENVTEKRFKQISEFVASEKQAFDFNKIVPMPEELNLEEGGANDFFKDLWKKFGGLIGCDPDPDADYNDILHMMTAYELDAARRYIEGHGRKDGEPMSDLSIVKEAMRRGYQYLRNREMYGGCETWYGWCIENWGTKWNAYYICEPEDEAFGWEFNTAWSAPEPVLTVLSAIFRNARFILRYADEDLGQNCGIIVFENGEKDEFPALTEEIAYQFAVNLWRYSPEDLDDEDDEDEED